MDKLKKWLNAKGINQQEFAGMIGVSNAAVTRYLQGRIPEPEIIKKIYSVTHHKITPNDWYIK